MGIVPADKIKTIFNLVRVELMKIWDDVADLDLLKGKAVYMELLDISICSPSSEYMPSIPVYKRIFI